MVDGSQWPWVCLGSAPRVTRITAHCLRLRGDAAPHWPSQLRGQSLSAGSLHCCSRVVLQHLSSSTGPPKDGLTEPQWHRAPLSPMDIPQGQTKKPFLFCPAHLPAGWGDGKKINAREEFPPAQYTLPNWEVNVACLYPQTISHHGYSFQWALKHLMWTFLLITCCPPDLPHSFIHSASP